MLKSTLLSALLIGGGCASMRIHTQVAPEVELGHYRAFAWLPSSKGGPETIVDQQIRSALRRQLTHKGLRETTPDSADFLVDYHVLQEHKLAVADWGNGIYGWAPDVVAYSDGTLIVDFINPRSNRVFWRGSATAAIEPPGVVDVNRLDKAASAMVRRYPYSVASAQ
jgi:hypothetical protein